MTENIENTANPFVETETQEENEPDINDVPDEDKLKKEIEDINNKYIRLAADFDNYRKRQLQERESLIKYGAKETLQKIIPVLDTFSRAADSIEKSEDINSIKESCSICTKQLNDVLNKIGLTKIEAEGKEFDPATMEAVMQTQTDEVEPNYVIKELQAGYKLYDMVLRPAMVNVASEKEEDKKE
ncbi:MAG: nucleotide exchange factor GrpE [Candidatus Gastranaerophilales bacterium]|nr:nucleotide exchange factor GrpE [Candidatus Gastranaerophilales bacterium]